MPWELPVLHSFFISVLCIYNRFSAHSPYSNVEARKSYKWKEVNDCIFVGNDVEMTFPQRMNAPILGCIWIITACRSLLDILKTFVFDNEVGWSANLGLGTCIMFCDSVSILSLLVAMVNSIKRVCSNVKKD